MKDVKEFIAKERERIAELEDEDAYGGRGLHSGGHRGETALLDRLEAEVADRVTLLEGLLKAIDTADDWAQPRGQYDRYDDRTVTRAIRRAMRKAGLR